MTDRLSVAMTALTATLLAAAIAPLFMVEIPAMLDYPNHLARMRLLSGAGGIAYEAHWRLYPNLAMDLIVPGLARWIGATTAAKLFLGFSQILLVGGAVFLEWVVKGRHRLGGLGALLVLFSAPLAWGAMNFELGLGLAAWSLGLWIALREKPAPLRWMVHAASVAALFVAHFAALGIYGLTVGLWELSRVRRPVLLASLARLAAFIASPVALILGATAWLGGQVGQAPAFVWRLGRKASSTVLFFDVYNPPLALIILTVMTALAALFAVERWMRLDRAGMWVAAGFAVVFLVLPQRAFGAWDPDVRILTAAGVILPAFLFMPPTNRLGRAAGLGVIVALILAEEVALPWSWLSYRNDYHEFQASFARLAPGSAVLVARSDRLSADETPLLQAIALAAPEANVFVSNLFSVPGEQPIAPKPAFATLNMASGSERVPPSFSRLAAIAAGAPAADQPNLQNWQAKYQYLYVIGGAQPGQVGGLTRLNAGRRFALYRVGAPP